MIHPLRTLLYELLVEPLARLGQQCWDAGLRLAPQTATPHGSGPPPEGTHQRRDTLEARSPEARPEEKHELCNL